RARRERLVAVNVPSPRTVRFLYRPRRPATIAGFTDRSPIPSRSDEEGHSPYGFLAANLIVIASGAKQSPGGWGLLRRFAPRNDSVALMTDDLAFTSAAELARLIAGRQVSPVEVVDAVLDRIERAQPALNAFI